MARDENDYELASELCEHAIRYASELETPPIPDCYELLYHHAAGYDPALSEAITNTVRKYGRLPSDHAGHLYETFLSSKRHVAPLRQGLSECAAGLRNAIDKAERGTSEFCLSLQDANIDRALEEGPEAAAAIIRDLLRANNAISRQARELQQNLAASMQEVNHLAKQIATVRQNAECDPLTRLPTRRRFHEAMGRALSHAHAQSDPLSLLLIDLDDFRTFNKVHGRNIGDKVLRFAADRIRSRAQDRYIVARYAGDQFAVLLPNTRLEIAVKFAEHLRTDILGMKFIRKTTGRRVERVTASVGAVLCGHDDVQDTLIERAQQCLSAAKRLGRNRVRSAANTKGFLAAGQISSTRAETERRSR